MFTLTPNFLDVIKEANHLFLWLIEGHELISTEPHSLVRNYLNESLNMFQHSVVVIVVLRFDPHGKISVTIQKKDLQHIIISYASLTDLDFCV